MVTGIVALTNKGPNGHLKYVFEYMYNENFVKLFKYLSIIMEPKFPYKPNYPKLTCFQDGMFEDMHKKCNMILTIKFYAFKKYMSSISSAIHFRESVSFMNLMFGSTPLMFLCQKILKV